MEYGEHLASVERDVARIGDALRAGPLDVVVPSCPDWTLRALTEHVGAQFCAFWCHVLCEANGHDKPDVPALPADDDDVAAWFDGCARGLVDELHATTPDTNVWTWVPDQQHAAFVARRAAHELAVHRYDAQLARNTNEPIEADVAADGIEEIFVMADAWRVNDPTSGCGNGETVHVHGTDEGRNDEWLLTLTPDGLRVERAHAKGDLALRGAVSDLELTLYGRPTVSPVERFGDERALDAWRKAFTFG